MATRIISRHMTRRTATWGLHRLQALQARAAAGDAKAANALTSKRLAANEPLSVRKEQHRFYKWATIAE